MWTIFFLPIVHSRHTYVNPIVDFKYTIGDTTIERRSGKAIFNVRTVLAIHRCKL
jgi:hypothetical protein